MKLKLSSFTDLSGRVGEIYPRLYKDVKYAQEFLANFTAPSPGPYVFGDIGGGALNLLVLGDSSSVGVGGSLEESISWVIATKLSEHQGVRLTLRGVAGARAYDIQSQLHSAEADQPITILVCVGSNDARDLVARKTNLHKIESNFSDFTTEIKVRWPDASVFLTGAADLGSVPILGATITGRGLRKALDAAARQVNNRVKKVAREAGVTYVPVAKLVSEAFRSNKELFAEDGFHPGGEGYRIIARALLPEIQSATKYQRN